MKEIFPKKVKDKQEELNELLERDMFLLKKVSNNKIRHMLTNIAISHSILIEYPEHKTTHYKNEIRSLKRDATRNLQQAWTETKNELSNTHEVTPQLITKILKTVEPWQTLHPIEGVRSYDAELQNINYHPPSPTKILGEIHSMIQETRKLDTPLEKAIYTHFHIARIQPGEDGNKRTARLIQNAYLCSSNLLPIIINSKLRSAYLDAFEESIEAYYNHDNIYLEPFSTFLLNRLDDSVHSYMANVKNDSLCR
ncbi:MAG: Fic family protein [Nanoarchaeota archaeon]|nr:Fic family protein [Nanoarchaeota archaeon]